MHPNKLLLNVLAWVAYIWLTIRILFVEVPPLLREADTATNGAALMMVILWVVFTLYAIYSWWFKKNQLKIQKDKK